MERRPYRLSKRRERQEETRSRIVAATAALHEELGPAATTISAIAERAGVQRLTVYRHFPDDLALFQACSAHWSVAHPAPDPSAWAHLRDPRERLRAALTALYVYYRGGQTMLARVLRDAETMPALAEVVAPFHVYLDRLVQELVRPWEVSEGAGRLLRAGLAHAVAFGTWRSLTASGLSDAQTADVMVGMVAAAARMPGSRSRRVPAGSHRRG